MRNRNVYRPYQPDQASIGREPTVNINMKSHAIAARATTLLLLAASVAEAGHHGHSRKHFPRHAHGSVAENAEVEKRGGQCEFPTDAGLVAVTPGEQNAGWAMSPDQPCTRENYCPYACPPGQVSVQWDPEATFYGYPQSMVFFTPWIPSYPSSNCFPST